MAEEQINLVDYETLMHTLPPAISAALYQKGLAEIRGPPGIVRNTLEHMGMIETEKPGPEDEIEGCSGLFTRGNEAGDLEKGLLDERGQPANLATIYRTMDVRGVLGAYFAKPVVKTIAGLLNGRKDYDTDKFLYGYKRDEGVEGRLAAAKIKYEYGEYIRKIEAAKEPEPNNVSTFYRFIKNKQGKFDAVPEGRIVSFGEHPSDWPKDGVYDIDFSKIPIVKAKPKEIDHTHITCD